MSEPTHAIGSTVYIFDENRRVYSKEKFGGPIYREHFVAHQIIGEEGRSWVVQKDRFFPFKVGKVKAREMLLTPDAMEERCWLNDHRYKVARAVENCTDVATLQKIAEMLGYVP